MTSGEEGRNVLRNGRLENLSDRKRTKVEGNPFAIPNADRREVRGRKEERRQRTAERLPEEEGAATLSKLSNKSVNYFKEMNEENLS